ncbi:efflux RND transporter permease subunit [Phascolarctobacterium succinatutens]|uniref:efflux RND transporter permease subunit n=1 Tax=Phascolarctobacterium succinatutens TaxID=626940 RepID=UPI0026F017A1|nr:efflux RND transporter permease subunit [Phascolarctobacterium succinatutens]
MNITRFSIKRPIGICMIYILVCVLGLISFFRIGVELLPDVDSKFISVIVNYPGASTESVEQQVTKPIEDELSSISHFKQVRSATRPGRAEIFVELDSQADADMVAIEATKKVSRIRKNLPEDIDEPAVLKRSSEEYPIIQIAATSKDNLDDIFALADSSFKERLQQAAGVADVDVTGGRTKEVAIEVDKDKLNYYGLTLQDIITAVRKENIIVSSGSVYTDALEKTVRLQAQYKAPEEIQHLQLKGAGGRYIELGQVANVQAKDKRAVAYSRVDGNEAVSLEVYKASGANIVDTADGVLQQLETLRKDYPDYVFTVVYDQSHFVRDSLSNTLKTLLEGLVTTGLVLYLFLRGWKSSMAVMIAIPTSLIATFFLMYLAGFTFNMMSLMGMALCIGILVDDSIVVLENIHRFLAMGKSADVAAEEGRNEIGMAAIAMTLCDVVVFLPIAFMQSATGQFFKQFGMTIVFATLMSLVVSFTLTPMLASHFYKNGVEEPKGKLWSRLDDFEAQTIAKYDLLLRKCIEKPKKLVLGVLAAFAVAVALVPLGIVGSEYMPRTDESAIQVNIELPTGFNADQTNEALLLFEDYLAKVPEIEHYMTNVTTTQSMGKLVIALKSSDERSKDVWQVAQGIRSFAKQNLGEIKVRVNEIQSSVTGVSGGRNLVRSPVQVELKGSDMDQLVADSAKVEQIFASTAGLKDIKNSYVKGMPELKVTVDRDKLKYYHATVNDVAQSFNAAIGGRSAGVLANDVQNHGNDTDIAVRFAGGSGYNIEDVRAIPVQTGRGSVFLGDLADVEEGVGPITIRRVNKERIINIQCNLTDRPLNEVVKELTQKLNAAGLKSTYEFSGQATTMNDSFAEMAMALSLSLLLIYLLLAVLYESVFTPFIRMFSLPLGIIGAIFCLLLTHNTINLYSLIGILVMDGLVAKNGTLLLDYTLTLMHEGMTAKAAVIEAGKTRLKPIFMTALTMVVGMLPTALSLSAGSETRVSMAWVIIGGMITSTVFTLLVLPILFLWLKEKFPSRI